MFQTKQRTARLTKVREIDRQLSTSRAQQYDEALRASEAAALAKQQDASDTTARQQAMLADKFDQAVQNVGMGHEAALQFTKEREEQMAAKQIKEDVWLQQQKQRHAAALQHVREEQSRRVHGTRQAAALRAQALQMAREQAQRFAALQQEQAAASRQHMRAAHDIDVERKRHGSHSLIDFKHSRIHEQLPIPHTVSRPDAAPSQELEDPHEAAHKTAESLHQAHVERLAARAEAEARAQQRFKAAQAKLKAEQYRQKIEAELAAMEADKRKARQAEVTLHKLKLQDRTKQQELVRVFENTFGQPGSTHPTPPVPASTGAAPARPKGAPAGPATAWPHARDQGGGQAPGGWADAPRWSTSRTSLRNEPPAEFSFKPFPAPREELPPLPAFPFMGKPLQPSKPNEATSHPRDLTAAPSSQGHAELATPAEGSAGASADLHSQAKGPGPPSEPAAPQPSQPAGGQPAHSEPEATQEPAAGPEPAWLPHPLGGDSAGQSDPQQLTVQLSGQQQLQQQRRPGADAVQGTQVVPNEAGGGGQGGGVRAQPGAHGNVTPAGVLPPPSSLPQQQPHLPSSPSPATAPTQPNAAAARAVLLQLQRVEQWQQQAAAYATGSERMEGSSGVGREAAAAREVGLQGLAELGGVGWQEEEEEEQDRALDAELDRLEAQLGIQLGLHPRPPGWTPGATDGLPDLDDSLSLAASSCVSLPSLLTDLAIHRSAALAAQHTAATRPLPPPPSGAAARLPAGAPPHRAGDPPRAPPPHGSHRTEAGAALPTMPPPIQGTGALAGPGKAAAAAAGGGGAAAAGGGVGELGPALQAWPPSPSLALSSSPTPSWPASPWPQGLGSSPGSAAGASDLLLYDLEEDGLSSVSGLSLSSIQDLVARGILPQDVGEILTRGAPQRQLPTPPPGLAGHADQAKHTAAGHAAWGAAAPGSLSGWSSLSLPTTATTTATTATTTTTNSSSTRHHLGSSSSTSSDPSLLSLPSSIPQQPLRSAPTFPHTRTSLLSSVTSLPSASRQSLLHSDDSLSNSSWGMAGGATSIQPASAAAPPRHGTPPWSSHPPAPQPAAGGRAHAPQGSSRGGVAGGAGSGHPPLTLGSLAASGVRHPAGQGAAVGQAPDATASGTTAQHCQQQQQQQQQQAAAGGSEPPPYSGPLLLEVDPPGAAAQSVASSALSLPPAPAPPPAATADLTDSCDSLTIEHLLLQARQQLMGQGGGRAPGSAAAPSLGCSTAGDVTRGGLAEAQTHGNVMAPALPPTAGAPPVQGPAAGGRQRPPAQQLGQPFQPAASLPLPSVSQAPPCSDALPWYQSTGAEPAGSSREVPPAPPAAPADPTASQAPPGSRAADTAPGYPLSDAGSPPWPPHPHSPGWDQMLSDDEFDSLSIDQLLAMQLPGPDNSRQPTLHGAAQLPSCLGSSPHSSSAALQASTSTPQGAGREQGPQPGQQPGGTAGPPLHAAGSSSSSAWQAVGEGAWQGPAAAGSEGEEAPGPWSGLAGPGLEPIAEEEGEGGELTSSSSSSSRRPLGSSSGGSSVTLCPSSLSASDLGSLRGKVESGPAAMTEWGGGQAGAGLWPDGAGPCQPLQPPGSDPEGSEEEEEDFSGIMARLLQDINGSLNLA